MRSITRSLHIWIALSAIASSVSGQDPTIRIRDVETQPGRIFEVVIETDHPDPLDGFQASLAYDPTVMTSVPVAAFPEDHFCGLDLASLLFPATVEFAYVEEETIFNPGLAQWFINVLFDFSPPFDGQTLPPGTGISLFRATFQASSDLALVGTSSPVSFVDEFPFHTRYYYATIPVTPEFEGGSVTFVDDGGFLRGDLDGSNMVGIPDAIQLLQHLFVGGSDPLPCVVSADTNDDGALTIVDAIQLLNYLFLDGCQPSAPFPECNVDPDGLVLPCDVPTC